MNLTGKIKKSALITITKRELVSYFTSPVAYIVGALFLLASGILFFTTFFLQDRADLRSFFEILPILFSFFIPAMTMRIFSEEKNSGTIEMLVTLPVRTSDIVLGKYISVFISSIVLLLPTVSYAVTCACFAETSMDKGPVIGGFAGALFLSAAFCSIGMFASSITKNQIIAFFAAFAVSIFLTMLPSFSYFMPSSFISFATFISTNSHFDSISKGVIDSRDIIYFLSMTAVFITATVRSINNSRRRG